jgi:hypothetical protein
MPTYRRGERTDRQMYRFWRQHDSRNTYELNVILCVSIAVGHKGIIRSTGFHKDDCFIMNMFMSNMAFVVDIVMLSYEKFWL